MTVLAVSVNRYDLCSDGVDCLKHSTPFDAIGVTVSRPRRSHRKASHYPKILVEAGEENWSLSLNEMQLAELA